MRRGKKADSGARTWMEPTIRPGHASSRVFYTFEFLDPHGLTETNYRDDHMQEKGENVAHSRMVSRKEALESRVLKEFAKDSLRDLRLSSRLRDYRCMQRPDVFPAPPRPPMSRYTRWHALQAFVRSSVNSERASLFFVCASRYDRLATEII